MMLLDDPKIPTARRNPRRPNHSHKPLDVATKMGLKPEIPYCTRRRHHHLITAPTNLDPKNRERSPQNRGRSPPTDKEPRSTAPPWPKGPRDGRSATAPAVGRWDPNRVGRLCLGRNVPLYQLCGRSPQNFHLNSPITWPLKNSARTSPKSGQREIHGLPLLRWIVVPITGSAGPAASLRHLTRNHATDDKAGENMAAPIRAVRLKLIVLNS
jgi:hypothetical protein